MLYFSTFEEETSRLKDGLKKLRTGTTTVGVSCTNGVVLATDRRVTSGIYIAHKRGRKIVKLDDRIAVTIAGLVADAQMITDYLRAQLRIMKYSGQKISVKAIATLASNILFSGRLLPFIVQFIVAGMDDEGAHIYALDWFGTLTREKYIATGSGSPYALGVLESGYRPDLTVEEALPMVLKAVKAAMSRDPGSGEGVDVVVITKEGVRELSDQEISKLMG